MCCGPVRAHLVAQRDAMLGSIDFAEHLLKRLCLQVLEIVQELLHCFRQQRACITSEACNRFLEFVL